MDMSQEPCRVEIYRKIAEREARRRHLVWNLFGIIWGLKAWFSLRLSLMALVLGMVPPRSTYFPVQLFSLLILSRPFPQVLHPTRTGIQCSKEIKGALG